jgi:hypothetical protein
VFLRLTRESECVGFSWDTEPPCRTDGVFQVDMVSSQPGPVAGERPLSELYWLPGRRERLSNTWKF